MTKLRVKFTFPPERVTEPVIYSLGKDYNIITNIRRANVTRDRGWVVLELDGEEDDIQRGIGWVTSKGVRVDPIAGDVMEG
ncbi:MAG: NIL domain-containing protein [Dehalococcoidia bacterium]|nr:NIL domain-containing protein [Dehalococcoidia bacterium]